MKKRPSLKYMMESSLKTEVISARVKNEYELGGKSFLSSHSLTSSMQVQQLEKCLKDQFAVRRALEKALRRNSSSIDESSISYIPKVSSLFCFFLSKMQKQRNMLFLFTKTKDPLQLAH